LLSVAFSALSAVVTASPAQANCYETFGCTHGQHFDCLYDDIARVPRNDFERANVSKIQQAESIKGC
jgi:hypothetical protein